MRDWVLPLSPVLIVGYFIVFPDQLSVLVSVYDWVAGYLFN
ncbi:MAG: hypothetical protein OJF62_003366 [Pseudolabrys sp.]|jgi:hypothetical protein|nr:hypothetical protein [Pseudolabrys sp.]